MYIKHSKPVFTERDMWNLDSTLSQIIHSSLVKFKETIIRRSENNQVVGVPSQIYPDIQNITDDDENQAWKDWLNILDKMIYAFGDNEPDILEYDFEFITEYSKPESPHDYVEMSITPSNEQEYQRYGYDVEIHCKRVKEGLELFGKHFQSLWI